MISGAPPPPPAAAEQDVEIRLGFIASIVSTKEILNMSTLNADDIFMLQNLLSFFQVLIVLMMSI